MTTTPDRPRQGQTNEEKFDLEQQPEPTLPDTAVIGGRESKLSPGGKEDEEV